MDLYIVISATTTDSDKYEIIMAGADWVLKDEKTKKEFLKYSYDCKNLYSLCAGELTSRNKDEILFLFQLDHL